ncbi:hypothetical protein C4D60_Mb08t30790 [Musa balbisiana]|uniref:Uncharacterized protein n=1 Tax=Musa balbisiana TaxID=52838 RepID=A0A4S8K7T6_MUSBA|nr:hypothetical protein C4D60_Mb08t30790 [Musa balbisiana]
MSSSWIIAIAVRGILDPLCPLAIELMICDAKACSPDSNNTSTTASTQSACKGVSLSTTFVANLRASFK